MNTSYNYRQTIKNFKINNEILIDCIYSADRRYHHNKQKYEAFRTYYRIYHWLEDTYNQVKKYKKLANQFLTIEKELLQNFEPKYLVFDIDPYSGELIQYYLYYDLGKYVFLVPIDSENVDFPNLETKNYDELDRTQNPDDDFLSTQFVKKVNRLMKTNQLTFE